MEQRLRLVAGLLAGGMLLWGALARAAETPTAAEGSAAPPAVALAAAYQGAFYDLLPAACFQLYSTLGIIAGDLGAGHINRETAMAALDRNSLLLGVCTDSLAAVKAKTPAEDKRATALLAKLAAILAALGGLDNALVDACSASSAKEQSAANTAVNVARQKVEDALKLLEQPVG
jgi:hypothetical protein